MGIPNFGDRKRLAGRKDDVPASRITGSAAASALAKAEDPKIVVGLAARSTS